MIGACLRQKLRRMDSIDDSTTNCKKCSTVITDSTAYFDCSVFGSTVNFIA